MVVHKGVLESPFLLCPVKVFKCFKGKPQGGREETDSPKTPFWTTVSPHDAFTAPLAHSDTIQRNSLLCWVFSAAFLGLSRDFLGFQGGWQILGVWGGFPWFWPKDQGKEDQGRIRCDLGRSIALLKGFHWHVALEDNWSSRHSRW